MKTDRTALPENQPACNIEDFARQIWLAGLGAFASAQEEGGKVFNALVEEGQKVDTRMKTGAEPKTGQIKNYAGEIAKGKVENLHGSLTGAWSKLEEVFQARVARALSRLGVPIRHDVQRLLEQMDLLNANIQELKKFTEAETRTKKALTAKSPVSIESTKPVA